jgi:hypothetical protein
MDRPNLTLDILLIPIKWCLHLRTTPKELHLVPLCTIRTTLLRPHPASIVNHHRQALPTNSNLTTNPNHPIITEEEEAIIQTTEEITTTTVDTTIIEGEGAITPSKIAITEVEADSIQEGMGSSSISEVEPQSDLIIRKDSTISSNNNSSNNLPAMNSSSQYILRVSAITGLRWVKRRNRKEKDNSWGKRS